MPPSVDAVVVGAGVAGLAASIELAKAGREVVLLESGRIGNGASGRNMGLVSGVAKEAEAYFLSLLKDADADCDTQYGALLLSPTRKNLQDLELSIPRRKEEYGSDDFVVTREQLAEHIGGNAQSQFAGGLLMPGAMFLNPGKMMLALANYARSIGVIVCENVAATGWHQVGDVVAVRCGEQQVRANDVLLTIGGYGTELSQWLWQRTLPVPSTVAVSEELPSDLLSAAFPSSNFVMVNRFRGYNCRLSPDGKRLMLAGSVADVPISATADLRQVRGYFERLFPAFAGIEFTHCWTGFAGSARDRKPHVGRQGSVWYATGASGLAYSAETGRQVAGRIVDGLQPDRDEFPIWPFRNRRELLWAGIRLAARSLDVMRRSRLR